MEQEWRASVTADAVYKPLDEQFEELSRHLDGIVRHETGDERLHLLWRLTAFNLEEATQKTLEAATESLRDSLGYMPRLVDLRVVTAEQADVE